MKFLWTRTKFQMEQDPKYWFHTLESGLFDRNVCVPGVPPYQLHYGMFMSGIQKLGSDKQWKLWEKDVRELRKMGCYA